MTLTFGSLFAGIGGIDLGLERAGMDCDWQVEINEHASRILAKHWPHVERFSDVVACGATNLSPGDEIAGGFPCQDISFAGLGAGLEGERSGLWREFHRIIGELRPQYVLVENVAALLDRGIGRVLGDLAESGYDAEWTTISACAVGAPHTRERLFIVAYPHRSDGQTGMGDFKDGPLPIQKGRSASRALRWLHTETGVHRRSDGLPDWMDRLERLGNSVVPQVVEWIGRRIIEDASCRP